MYKPELQSQAVDLLKSLVNEGALHQRSINEEKFARLLELPNVFFAFYRKSNEQIIGGMMGCVTESFFGNDVIASDMGLYVYPEYRGGMASVRLVRAFEDWAKSKGVNEINIGQTTGIHMARTSQLYEKMG